MGDHGRHAEGGLMTWHRLYIVTCAAWLVCAAWVSAMTDGPPLLAAALGGAGLVVGYRPAGRMGR